MGIIKWIRFRKKFIAIFLIGTVLFGISFIAETSVKDKQGWVQGVAVVCEVEYSEVENTDTEAVRQGNEPMVWGQEKIRYTYEREDGSTGEGRYTRSEIHPRDGVRTSSGDRIDIIYNPLGTESLKGDLPDGADLVMVYVLRIIGAGLALLMLWPVADSIITRLRDDGDGAR